MMPPGAPLEHHTSFIFGIVSIMEMDDDGMIARLLVLWTFVTFDGVLTVLHPYGLRGMFG